MLVGPRRAQLELWGSAHCHHSPLLCPAAAHVEVTELQGHFNLPCATSTIMRKLIFLLLPHQDTAGPKFAFCSVSVTGCGVSPTLLSCPLSQGKQGKMPGQGEEGHSQGSSGTRPLWPFLQTRIISQLRQITNCISTGARCPSQAPLGSFRKNPRARD